MRICLLSPESCAGKQGGIATYTANLANALAEEHDVTVVLPGPRGNHREGAVAFREIPLPPRLHLPFGNRYLGNTLAAIPFILACQKEVNQLIALGLDVVESPEWMAGGLLSAIEGKVPVVSRLHSHLKLVRSLNGLEEDLDTRIMSMLERALILRSSLVLANSQALARRCALDLGIPEERIAVLPLGIDTQLFAPKEEALSDQPTILFLGRLERRKGVDTLIEAFADIAGIFPRARLVLAGASTETAAGRRDFKEELRERHRELINRGRLMFLGEVPYERIPSLCAECDILAAPSPFEPFGMVYLEAMSSGKPVVGCRAGGAPEVVSPGKTGFLVQPNDKAELSEAFALLLSNDWLRAEMGRRAREHVLKNFDSGHIAQRTLQCYLSACEAWHRRKRDAYAQTA